MNIFRKKAVLVTMLSLFAMISFVGCPFSSDGESDPPSANTGAEIKVKYDYQGTGTVDANMPITIIIAGDETPGILKKELSATGEVDIPDLNAGNYYILVFYDANNNEIHNLGVEPYAQTDSFINIPDGKRFVINVTFGVADSTDCGSVLSFLVDSNQDGSGTSLLAGIDVNNGTISPAFIAGLMVYTVTTEKTAVCVAAPLTSPDLNNQKTVNLNLRIADVVSITVNGNFLFLDNDCNCSLLDPGENTLSIVVTNDILSGGEAGPADPPEDPSAINSRSDVITTETYTITINRTSGLSLDATLSDLIVYGGTMDPEFPLGTDSYTIETSKTNYIMFPNYDLCINSNYSMGSEDILMDLHLNEPHAFFTVNDNSLSEGQITGELSPGTNIFEVVVFAEGKSTKTYTLIVSTPETK